MEGSKRSAYVLVNGLQLLQCPLPTRDQQRAETCFPVCQRLEVMDDRGRFELSCLFYASVDVVEEWRPWTASLKADDEEILLGQVPDIRGETRIVCRYVPHHPENFTLSVTFTDAERFGHPDEGELIKAIRLILLHDDFRRADGFVKLSHLHNKLDTLEVYKRVLGPTVQGLGHYRNLYAFIASHSDELELKQNPGGEATVALRDRHATPRIDSEERRARDQHAVSMLAGIVADRNVDATTALATLGHCQGFRETLRPSEQMLFRFLRSHDQEFFAQHDSVHTTRVGSR